MKPRAVVITIEAESDATVQDIKAHLTAELQPGHFPSSETGKPSQILIARQVKVQVVQAVKAG